MKKLKLKIQRVNPTTDKKPYYSYYELTSQPGMTVLDALKEIKSNYDGALSFRASCQSFICGSCGMNINKENRLACYTQIEKLKTKTILIKPLPGLKILKDLVVDMEPFFKKFELVKPYLVPDNKIFEKEMLQSSEKRKLLTDVINCILCNNCSSSCPITWLNDDYLGPAVFVKAWRFAIDSRDVLKKERLKLVNDENIGVWRCHTVYNCVDACPKKIDVTKIINAIRYRILNLSIGD